MKRLIPTFLFIGSVLCILCVGFYPHWCWLLYPAFLAQFIALFIYTYDVLKVKKQAVIKAYYKLDSALYRYFGRFMLTKIISFFVALIGTLSLFLTLIFPNGSEILILCLLVPCNIYALKVAYIICRANLSADFAPTLAKKYTAFFCAILSSIGVIFLSENVSATDNDIQAHYNFLMQTYNISQMPCKIWQEFFGFILLKKALLDVLYANVNDIYMQIALNILFAFGHFASFVSFGLLCIGGISLKQDSQNQSTFTESKSFRHFFAMLFFLIFLYIAFNISTHLQPLAKNKAIPALLSTYLMQKNKQYIQFSMHGIQTFINVNDLPSLRDAIQKNLDNFQMQLNADIEQCINEYLSQSDIIIDKYSQWYFSVSGEYTRLFYAALGKSENIAEAQLISLLKIHTPYDLQEQLNIIYDKHIEMLKKRLEQSFGFFIREKKPNESYVAQVLSFEDFSSNVDVLSPRANDGVAMLLGASAMGVMILKASSKTIAKTGAKVIGKSVAKKSLSGAVGSGGSILCGSFAPLCAIGFFVASDYAINNIDKSINQDSFKEAMREGFTSWKFQLKNRLISYNSQLAEQILENLDNSIKLDK